MCSSDLISQISDMVASSKVSLGSQNVSDQESGAFTGEIGCSMLKEFACEYAIVGHSERRAIYGESDDDVAKKFTAAQKGGLIPILCVGELLEERESGQTEVVVERQLSAIINSSGVASLKDSIIAYEPVWAIGTGKTASPDQAQDVHFFIRSVIAKYDESVSQSVQILYGGSVKGSNAKELFSMQDIDGGLIGGASLKSDDFLAICNAAG